MSPTRGQNDNDLLELARATEQLAKTIADPLIATRLRQIAQEVRAMAQHGSDISGACLMPA